MLVQDSLDMRRKIFSGAEVRKIRKERGLSRTELALLSGVSQSTIAYTETGGRVPQPAVIQRLAKGLGISVRKLYIDDTGDEDELPEHVRDAIAVAVREALGTDPPPMMLAKLAARVHETYRAQDDCEEAS